MKGHDQKNLNILKHIPCETELLDIGKTSIIKEEIIKSEISKLKSMLEKNDEYFVTNMEDFVRSVQNVTFPLEVGRI